MTESRAKVAVIYYSMYGHIKQLTDEFVKGLSEAGCDVSVFRAPELLAEEVVAKMGAPGPDTSVPLMDYAAIQTLPEFDGIAFGVPTRYGMMAHQMKSVFDGMGQLWMKGALIGKPATVFVSTGTQGGGQETTNLTAITQLVHLGMIYVPTGYSFPKMFDMNEIHGGSPYGAGTFAGPDGSRQPSDLEKEFGAHHGKHFGKTVVALKKGSI